MVSCLGTAEQYASEKFETVIKEFPNLKIVIEHLGGVGDHLGSGTDDTTAAYELYHRVPALARYPKTYMKVPGLGEICPRPFPFIQPMPFPEIPPVIEMAIDTFGAKRLMWGSDFPPSASREGYGNTLRFPMEQVKFDSEEDKEWVFGRAAATLWRFP